MIASAPKWMQTAMFSVGGHFVAVLRGASSSSTKAVKTFPLPLLLITCTLRGTLFLGTGMVLVQPCAGASGVFEDTGSLGTARERFTATLLPNGKVLVAGGLDDTVTALASAELYDPASGTWTPTGSLGGARDRHGAILLFNGKVLVAGGQDDTGNPLPSAELYDPASGTWTPTGSIGDGGSHSTETLLPNGKVLVTGGLDNIGNPLASAELYDPASGTWTPTGSLGAARDRQTATLLPNGKVLVTGGLGNTGSPLASAELYDPVSETWTPTGGLGTARDRHGALLLPSGKVLVGGGLDNAGNPLASAELYDPASGTWTPTGSLGTGRVQAASTLLPSGQVLVAGGSDGTSDLASAELYDPASGTWAPTGSLATAREHHTATLLPDGKVLVAGGLDNTANAIASAELYDLGPPLIISPLVATGTVGLPFTYQFEASGATSLGASNLPPGLTFNTNLAAIVGTPTASGTFPVGLSATNSAGTTNATLTITVQAAPSGPVIVSSTCATGRTGRGFSFQLQTSGGSPATRFAVDGLPPGLNLDPVTGFISGAPNPDGNFSLAVSAIDGAAITHATLQLTFTSDPTVPIITSSPTATLTPGQFFTYTITADANGTFGYIGTDGLVHQGPTPTCAGLPADLCFDGINKISGTFNPPFGHDGGSGRIPSLAGGIVTNVQLFATDPSGTGTFPLVGFINAAGTVQISTRLTVGTGNNVLIGGFIITGTGTTRALIRAIGPSLTSVGVPNALQDPTLELRDRAGSLLGSNDNWRDSQSYPIEFTGIPPTNNLESAILAFLSPGNYTAIVSGKNNTTGNALVEVYDLDIAAFLPLGNARLANISTRGFADTGDNVIIGGFFIRPQAPATSTRVIVRAMGPSLPVPGALGDPTLELRDGNGGLIDANDNWRSDHEAEIIATTIPPSNDLESAIVRDLTPGRYTAIVRGQANTTGVALVEVYALQ